MHCGYFLVNKHTLKQVYQTCDSIWADSWSNSKREQKHVFKKWERTLTVGAAPKGLVYDPQKQSPIAYLSCHFWALTSLVGCWWVLFFAQKISLTNQIPPNEGIYLLWIWLRVTCTSTSAMQFEWWNKHIQIRSTLDKSSNNHPPPPSNA